MLPNRTVQRMCVWACRMFLFMYVCIDVLMRFAFPFFKSRPRVILHLRAPRARCYCFLLSAHSFRFKSARRCGLSVLEHSINIGLKYLDETKQRGVCVCVCVFVGVVVHVIECTRVKSTDVCRLISAAPLPPHFKLCLLFARIKVSLIRTVVFYLIVPSP